MAIFLEQNELLDSYRDAQQDAYQYHQHFDEFERIAANRIRPDIPSNYPLVNDGTLASLMLENAKRCFPDLFTGRFTSPDRSEPWYPELLYYLWKNVVVPGAVTDADFYTKFWNLFYRSQQHGVAYAFSFFSAREDYTGADFTVDYVRDVYKEPGKITIKSSNYAWRMTYMTKLDVKRIIDYAENEEKTAKAKKRQSYNTWDIKLLKDFVDSGPTGKDSQNQNLSEREKQLQSKYYKFATVYHRGLNSPIYTMIPNLEGKVVRTRNNEIADIPITEMFHTNDLSSPFGKGLVEVAGATQNVLDYMTQADVLATQKGVEPPVKLKGSLDASTGLVLSSIIHAPNQIWKLGSADAQIVDSGTSIYQSLQSRIGLYKTNLMNQAGQFDTSASASDGNPQFSRTPAGVDNLETRGNVNDNFFINSGSIAFAHLAKTMMSIHLANMQGNDAFTLAQDEIERFEKAGWPLKNSNQIKVEYNRTRGKVKFVVDDPTKLNDPETEGLATIIKTLAENPEAKTAIESTGKYKVDIGEAYLQYFNKLRLSEPEKIIIPINPDSQNLSGDGQTQDQTTSQPAGQPQPAPKQPSEALNFKDVAAVAPKAAAVMLEQAGLPGDELAVKAAATQQPGANQEDPAALQQEHQQTVQQYGVDPETAMLIMAAKRYGIPEQDIANYVNSLKQGGSKQ